MKFRPAVVEDDASDTASDSLETIRLSLPAFGRKAPTVAYAPDAAPKRFEDAEVEVAVTTKTELQDEDDEGLGWLYGLGTVLAAGWIALVAIAPDMPLLHYIQGRLDILLPGLVLLMGLGGLWAMEGREKRRNAILNRAVQDLSIDAGDLGSKKKQAQALAKALTDVQLQMRGVNAQFWTLQKSLSDISDLKLQLKALGEDVSGFSTTSRQHLVEWEGQLSKAGETLQGVEERAAALSKDSIESCNFFAERIDDLNDNLERLTEVQDKAADTTRDFAGIVRGARDDMQEIIAESEAQQKAASAAQTEFRAQLRGHIADLTKELEGLGGIAKAFESVRADMTQASSVLSRGVRESLIDIKVLLDDWKQTKTHLEAVLGTATDRVTREFDAQLTGAKQFLAEWDYQLNSRLELLKGAQTQIQDRLELVPQALQGAARAVIAQSPELFDQLNGFRLIAAGVEQSVEDAKRATNDLSEIAPGLKSLRIEIESLAIHAAKAREDVGHGLSALSPDIQAIDAVTQRAQAFFGSLQDTTGKHLGQLVAMESVLERLQKPQAAQGVLEQLQPVLNAVEKLGTRCDDLEKSAEAARESFETMELKPLMKSLVLQSEELTGTAGGILAAIRPNDMALKSREDLPALTLRLRQVLEGLKPEVLASAIRSKSALRDHATRFTARFAAICEEARAGSPQGEWVAATLASSELGRIHRLLIRALEG